MHDLGFSKLSCRPEHLSAEVQALSRHDARGLKACRKAGGLRESPPSEAGILFSADAFASVGGLHISPSKLSGFTPAAARRHEGPSLPALPLKEGTT
ncbi:hypothetical protein AwMethylo_25220 [Methylobacterium sp.]|nr:hypothetical protein AwMethylo_25220 [Methylobacterium sp.]